MLLTYKDYFNSFENIEDLRKISYSSLKLKSKKRLLNNINKLKSIKAKYLTIAKAKKNNNTLDERISLLEDKINKLIKTIQTYNKKDLKIDKKRLETLKEFYYNKLHSLRKNKKIVKDKIKDYLKSNTHKVIAKKENIDKNKNNTLFKKIIDKFKIPAKTLKKIIKAIVLGVSTLLLRKIPKILTKTASFTGKSIGNLNKKILSKILKYTGIGYIFKKLSTFLRGFGKGGFRLGIYGAIASLIYTFKDEIFNLLKIADKKLTNIFGNKYIELKENIKHFYNIGVKYLNNIYEDLKSRYGDVFNNISNYYNKAIDYISNKFDNVKSNVINSINNISNYYNKTIDYISNKYNNFKNNIINTISNISNYYNKAIDYISNKFDNVKSNVINSINNISNYYNKTIDNISKYYNKTIDYISNKFDNIKSNVINSINFISDTISNTYNTIKRTFNNTLNSIIDKISNTYKSIKNSVSNNISKVLDNTKSYAKKVYNYYSNTAKIIENKYNNFKSNLKNYIKDKYHNISSSVENIIDNIKNYANKGYKALKATYNNTKKYIVNKYNSYVSNSIKTNNNHNSINNNLNRYSFINNTISNSSTNNIVKNINMEKMIKKIADIETSGGKNIQNKNGYYGLFQFNKKHWEDKVNKYLNVDWDTFVNNQDLQKIFMLQVIKRDYIPYLEKNNYKVTPKNIYLVHQLGFTGFKRLQNGTLSTNIIKRNLPSNIAPTLDNYKTYWNNKFKDSNAIVELSKNDRVQITSSGNKEYKKNTMNDYSNEKQVKKFQKVTTFHKPNREVYQTFIHCSATDNPNFDDAYYIDKWHKERGWKEIGYHFYIKKDGTIQRGRDINKIPAAQQGYNKGSIAICVGGLEKSKFTQAQFNSLRNFCKQINKAYNGNMRFRGHCEVSPKSCPVFDYKKVLNLDSKGRMRDFNILKNNITPDKSLDSMSNPLNSIDNIKTQYDLDNIVNNAMRNNIEDITSKPSNTIQDNQNLNDNNFNNTIDKVLNSNMSNNIMNSIKKMNINQLYSNATSKLKIDGIESNLSKIGNKLFNNISINKKEYKNINNTNNINNNTNNNINIKNIENNIDILNKKLDKLADVIANKINNNNVNINNVGLAGVNHSPTIDDFTDIPQNIDRLGIDY